jgi:hypothetical protein
LHAAERSRSSAEPGVINDFWFLVEKGTPGFVPTKVEHKIALRAVQNADR